MRLLCSRVTVNMGDMWATPRPSVPTCREGGRGRERGEGEGRGRGEG